MNTNIGTQLFDLRYRHEKATGLLALARAYGMADAGLEAYCIMLANDIAEYEWDAA